MHRRAWTQWQQRKFVRPYCTYWEKTMAKELPGIPSKNRNRSNQIMHGKISKSWEVGYL